MPRNDEFAVGVVIALFLTVIPLLVTATLSGYLGKSKLLMSKICGFFMCFLLVQATSKTLNNSKKVEAIGICVFSAWSLIACFLAYLSKQQGADVSTYLKSLAVSRVLIAFIFIQMQICTPLFMSCVVGSLQMLDTPLRKQFEDWGLPRGLGTSESETEKEKEKTK
eukprot:gb/GEZN01024866.1/.p1 GENE.gb/GEZN01024866.1/~~gb/GEZN01024866.1/.p1  ORF type:complete len:166 (+),score=14.00 gb/GEZN01024866.1/:25-522(+)